MNILTFCKAQISDPFQHLTRLLPCRLFVLVLSLAGTSAHAVNNSASIDPTQSIGWWKPYIISAEEDPQVATAQQIYTTVLRSWDRSRVEPQLHVVKSTGGPWAASLSDGNIIISQSALNVCFQFGRKRADHLIAFVLAHELAHQRADDLWHQKFLRIAEPQSAEVKQQLFRGLKIDNESLSDLAHREAQADHDGLLMMSSVGYDPHQIIGEKDFFTTWVEQIWQGPCTGNAQKTRQQSVCDQAKTRAMRTRTQLASIAAQTSLYQLGIQAFVGRDYTTADRYFLAYGKTWPGRAVFKSLGLVQLAQALEIYNEIQTTLKKPVFYFPLMLDTSPAATPVANQPGNTRSASTIWLSDKKQQLLRHTDSAINYFQRAVQIEPNHPDSYIYLAVSYLVSGNTFMSRGVLQGQYEPRFGSDLAADMFLAVTSAIEGKDATALRSFDKIIAGAQQLFTGKASKNTSSGAGKSGLSSAIVTYGSFYNAAIFASHRNNPGKAKKIWQKLASVGRKSGQSLLFRLALSHINHSQIKTQAISVSPDQIYFRPGDIFKPQDAKNNKLSVTLKNSFWLDGEKLQLYYLGSGKSIVTDSKSSIIGTWQNAVGDARIGTLQPGDSPDRPYKVFGIPSRHLYMSNGEYLAYDHLGIAFRLLDNKLAGWFFYQPGTG